MSKRIAALDLKKARRETEVGLPTIPYKERGRRSRILLGGRTMDPWARNPSPVEQATLVAEGFVRPDKPEGQ